MARVLLLTDDIWVENEVRAALTDPGTVVEVTSDPETIVDAVSRHQPEVVVIDLQVRWMGGMAVVRELRAAVENGHIPDVRMVLLLDRSADGFLARRAGADAYVVKPFTAQQLREAVSLPAGV
ncbi:MAG: response regulator [Actinomycetes bacterium]